MPSSCSTNDHMYVYFTQPVLCSCLARKAVLVETCVYHFCLSVWATLEYPSIHCHNKIHHTLFSFPFQDNYYVLSEGEDGLKLLRSCMKELISLRRQTGNPLGWDVPSSALHFNRVLSLSKYGDVFQGHFSGKEVAIKTLKPDCSSSGRDAFEREIEILT